MILEIKGLTASVDEIPLLRGIDLKVNAGEIHVIMGPNGAGKSTLAKVLSGHPAYELTGGDILLDGQELQELEPQERAQKGLFMSFQYPVEVAGVTNLQFLHTAYNALRKARGEKELPLSTFEPLLDEQMQLMEIKPEFKTRNLNEGFSGGEKKRNEILQMAILAPKVAILDETDSGLDIDAMRIVAGSIQQVMHPGMGLILITHYQRLLDYIKPDFVHVMLAGKIACSGGPELARTLEQKGYDWLSSTCAHRKGS